MEIFIRKYLEIITMPKKFKYQKPSKYQNKVIYKSGNFEVSINKMHTSKKSLLELLKERPLKRKEIMQKTNWTRGQIAGLLYRAKKEGLLELKNKRFYLKNA